MSKVLLDNLDLWTSTVRHKSTAGRGSNRKIELAGIKKLRELILELAVRGKLVPQDPNDEPASELLKRIEAEKAQLVKEGKLKKQKPLPEISDDEKPFELPQGWDWVKLGSLTEMYNGRAFKSSEWRESGIPIIRIQNLNSDSADFNYFQGELDPKNKIDNGDFLISWSGTPGTSFGAFIWNRGPAALNQHINKCDFFTNSLNMNFMLLAVNGRMNSFIERAVGAVGLKHVTRGVLDNALIALPPIKEQKHIANKFNELMTFCDQLEQQSEQQLSAHQQLVETLLATLTNAENADELNQQWQRLAQHFDLLFSGPMGAWAIDRLKETILQLAVMGKLVPQDPSDEPASELLKRIEAEKERLSNEGLRTKASSNINEEDKYLKAPHNWEWIRLGNLAKFIDYRGKTPNKTSFGVRLITAKNIKFGYIDKNPEEFISTSDYTTWMTRGMPRIGDILFTTEAPLGNIAIVDINERFALAQRAICFQWHEPNISKFMLIQMMANPFQNQLIEQATGMTATGIKASKLKDILVVIPPLAEQKRIVEKVDQLFSLCDQLKEKLNLASQTQLQLVDAVVDQALA